MRLKASDYTSLKPKTNWYRLTSPYNDTGSKSVGMVMMSLRFVRHDPTKQFNPERLKIEKSAK